MSETNSRLQNFIERPLFSNFITVVILVNAVTLGLETSPVMMDAAGPFLKALDRTALAIFVIELLLKLFVYRTAFFKSGWNIFDFVIVTVALVPANEAFAVLRALRILRALRLLSVVPQMRAVVGALLSAVPGMGAIIAVLVLVFYIGAVMATKLFAATFPQWFGSVGGSMYTLFQIMTLESWSMGIVRPVMEAHPYAWVFFVPFIILTSFAVLNLFIAIIVNSMQEVHELETRGEREALEAAAHAEREEMLSEIKALRDEISELRGSLPKQAP